MSIAKKIETALSRSSWIRKMFEEGARLKTVHGADKVFDFSLGNPNLKPPERFKTVLKELVSAETLEHGYMPNIGYPQVRKAVADYLSQEQGMPITENEVIMTCGAAGALNVILKTILDPGEEVIVSAPYFVEYGFYVDNHGGSLKTVASKSDFTLDMNAIEAAITEKTKAVLINSPNNPTGQIYSERHLEELGDLLQTKGKQLNRTIWLLSDEPYRKIVYDGLCTPRTFAAYTETVIASSYSKDLSIPGERIGYIAVHPKARYKTELFNGMALANRILGFVNAPALMQRAAGLLQGECADVSEYARKRKLLCDGLAAFGYEFVKPRGAFYLFPKTPIPDDVKFVQALQEERILTVPGSGFGAPGYFRIAFCTDDRTIINALPGFQKVIEKFR